MSTTKGQPIDPKKYPPLLDRPIEELDLCDEEATRQLGRALGSVAEDGDFIALIGELGAGKTTMMQGLVEAVDIEGKWRATSPTYALIQVYETKPMVYHMDLYRLEGWADLESIGYWDYAEGRRGITCVEWLDRIPSAWPGRGLIIELLRTKTGRMARLWGDANWRGRLADVVEILNPRSEEEK